jgi:hypothetical protein
MKTWRVRDWGWKYSVYKEDQIVAEFEDIEAAYRFMNDRVQKTGLYCDKCCTHLMVKGVCTIFCPNKECGHVD